MTPRINSAAWLRDHDRTRGDAALLDKLTRVENEAMSTSHWISHTADKLMGRQRDATPGPSTTRPQPPPRSELPYLSAEKGKSKDTRPPPVSLQQILSERVRVDPSLHASTQHRPLTLTMSELDISLLVGACRFAAQYHDGTERMMRALADSLAVLLVVPELQREAGADHIEMRWAGDPEPFYLQPQLLCQWDEIAEEAQNGRD